MGIKTEDFVPNLPPKTITPDVDWIGILERFDPTELNSKFINECARRNPFDTCYRWETPVEPVGQRLRSSRVFADFDRKDLEGCIRRIEAEGLTETTYKNTRAALIKAIGRKGAAEYNRREYERLGEEGRKEQEEEYIRWKTEREKQREEEERADSYDYYAPAPASLHEKIVKIRKGVLASNGKPLTQRDFAKYIGYPINKYTEAEKHDRYREGEESPVEEELLEKLIMICHANPFWLYDFDSEAYEAEYDMFEAIVQAGDAPSVYATPDVILRWIEAGKPHNTYWEDGRPE